MKKVMMVLFVFSFFSFSGTNLSAETLKESIIVSNNDEQIDIEIIEHTPINELLRGAQPYSFSRYCGTNNPSLICDTYVEGWVNGFWYRVYRQSISRDGWAMYSGYLYC